MNCMEFRREVLVDPRRISDEARGHAAACPGCSRFHAARSNLDERIAAGFAVPVPEGLARRVLDNTTMRTAARRRRFMAVAASLLLATAVGSGVYIARGDDPLARAGIDFVVDQEVNAILTSKPSDPSALSAVAAALNVRIPGQVGEVRYIGTCPFQDTIAHHVVIITPHGKATLLLLPERPVPAKARASGRGLHAVVAPAGRGSMAIIGHGADLQRIEDLALRG